MNLGRYQILAEIGKGSMGVVYKALDPNLDLVVALKVLRRDLIADEEFVARFLAEARALAKLDHPNIVRVFNADRDNFDVYIAMEFIDGDSLSARMKVNPFPQDKIIEFGTTMADALDYAHKRGIVHRDIKPSNILYTSDGRLKITDFGIAHIEDPSAQVMTQAGVILGTPAYMSPEQVLSHPVDGRSDLFSLGIILYELSTGSRPFAVQGMNAIFNAITSIDPLAVCKKNTGIPRGFSDVIMKCLNKEPGQRYADCRVLAEALHATGNARVISTAHTVHHTGRYNRNFVVYSVAGILLFLTISGLAVFFVSGYSTPKPQPKPVVQEQPSAPQPPPPAQSKQTVLNAESVPPGADVQIDGALQGITPMKMNILPGKHEVKISLRGYETWEAQVEMDKETETPLSVTLIRKGKR